ncbi:MAG: EamA family transporter [Firmicutes bacterium]|nr:EamA family transporter [Bacillota bacterium]
MWIVFAFASALFAGITSILAKCGIKKTNSYLATAIRTIVVLVFAWLMVGIVGSFPTILQITPKTMIFLILSGFATGASWICYFKALQLGDINKVVPVDKSSTVLTMLMAAIFLGEPLSAIKIAGIAGIGLGTWMMIEKKKDSDDNGEKKQGVSWFIFAALSALFASLTSILGKVGISQVESNLGTAIRTIVVLIMAWVVAGITGSIKEIRKIDKRELAFICLSGIATGGSWLCYYRALQDGPASVVVPIDKLSILVTIAFSYWVFKEKLTKKAAMGLVLIVIGTLVMLL